MRRSGSQFGTGVGGAAMLLPTIAATAQRAVASGRPDLGQSVALLVLGDSTGVTPTVTTGTIARLSERLAQTWPGVAVVRADWSDVLGDYGCGRVVGPAVPRYFLATAALVRSVDATAVGAWTDLDLRVTCALDSYSPPAGTRSFAGQYGASGSYGHRLQLRTDGKLNYNWSSDGANSFTATSTAALAAAMGLADGDRVQVRVTHDVDNGAGGSTVTFYARKPGDTLWTAIGAPIVAAGMTAIYRHATRPVEIGGTSSVGLPGKYFAVDYRAGIGGQSVLPAGLTIELVRGNENNTGTGGAPTIYIFNGSHAGAALAYMTQAARLPLIVPPLQVPVQLVVNDGHNEGAAVETAWIAVLDTALIAIRGRLPTANIACTTQNPRTDQPATSPRARMAQIVGWAGRNGLGLLDTYARMVRDGRPLATLLSDGLHPTDAGVDVLLGGYAPLYGK